MRMIEATSEDARTNGIARIGSQPIALATAALTIMLIGAGSVSVWRAYSGTSPEQDRVVAARQVQARTAQTTEQLVERTKALEASQQEAVDQLQIAQDQLLTIKRLLAAQQGDAKRLSDQVTTLTGAIDSLRQSFASSQSTESSSPSAARHAAERPRSGRRRHARRN
jgi:chromosome segregation ATPase